MSSAVPVNDPLVDRLMITRLPIAVKTAVGGPTNETAVDLIASKAANPGSVAAVLVGADGWAAGLTVDVKIQGSNDGFTTSTDIVTFTQLTNANFGTAQKVNLTSRFKAYRAVTTTAGTFSGQRLSPVLYLVGTNLRNTPYTDI